MAVANLIFLIILGGFLLIPFEYLKKYKELLIKVLIIS